ncbi:MAG TPA: hypothetical protein VN193_07305 [Candidatus Angelobacter sp.]|jgi:hypothetical protein|nr:hypothetical protein [Candidatus Angelobacter sp.]
MSDFGFDFAADAEERRLGELFGSVQAPESLRGSWGGVVAVRGSRVGRVAGRVLIGAPGERRLRPLAAALLIPLLVLGAVGGLGLRARLSGSAGPAENPPERASAAIAFDAARGDVVMFGGTGSYGLLNDTWIWDGDGWHRQHPSVSPGPRSGATMAFDPKTQRVVMLGGDVSGHGAMPSGETWTWDGATWHLEHPLHDPQSRFGFGDLMAADPASGQLVLVTEGSPMPAVGGSAVQVVPHGPGAVAVPPAVMPPPEAACSAAGGAAAPRPSPTPAAGGRAAVWSCISGTVPVPGAASMPHPVPMPPTSTSYVPTPVQPDLLPRGTWVWSGGDWVEQHPATSPLAPLGPQALAYDGSLHRLLLLTGQVQTCSVTATGSGIVGPRPGATPPPSTPSAMHSDTTITNCYGPAPMQGWSWDGRTWSKSPAVGSLSITPGPTVPLPDEGGLLMLTSSAATWTVQGGHWTRHDAGPGFTRRSGFAIAADPAHNSVVLFGGRTGPTMWADTWTWDGSRWTHRGGAVPPSPAPLPPHPVSIPGESGPVTARPTSRPGCPTGMALPSPGLIVACAIP